MARLLAAALKPEQLSKAQSAVQSALEGIRKASSVARLPERNPLSYAIGEIGLADPTRRSEKPHPVGAGVESPPFGCSKCRSLKGRYAATASTTLCGNARRRVLRLVSAAGRLGPPHERKAAPPSK